MTTTERCIGVDGYRGGWFAVAIGPETEVDIVVDTGQKLVPVEVKLSATPRPSMASNLKTFRKDLGAGALPGYVVHPGDVKLPLGADVTALPFGEL